MADVIGALITGMHVGSHIELPERIRHRHAIGSKDPATTMVVLIVGHDRPAHFRRSQFFVRLHNAATICPGRN